MKLRNKKTGKVLRVGEDVYIRSLDSGSIEVREDFGCGNKIEYFKTFAKMFERYEEIKEPLIKDEKVRKAVRAWAEVDALVYVEVETDYRLESVNDDAVIRFDDPVFKDLPKGRNLTLAELCGDEE